MHPGKGDLTVKRFIFMVFGYAEWRLKQCRQRKERSKTLCGTRE